MYPVGLLYCTYVVRIINAAMICYETACTAACEPSEPEGDKRRLIDLHSFVFPLVEGVTWWYSNNNNNNNVLFQRFSMALQRENAVSFYNTMVTE